MAHSRGVAAERNHSVFSIHHLAVPAVNFKRRTDAGKDQIGATNTFRFESIHPGRYTLREVL